MPAPMADPHHPCRRPIPLLLAAAATVATFGCGGGPTPDFDPRQVTRIELSAADETLFTRPEASLPGPRTDRDTLDVSEATARELASDDVNLLKQIGLGDVVAPITRPAGAGDPPDVDPLGADLPGLAEALAEVRGVEPVPLRAAIAKTAVNSFDVSVAAYEPAIEESRVIEAEARFDPTFQTNIEYQRIENQIAGISTGFAGSVVVDEQESIRSQTRIQKLLRSGGQAEISFGYTYLDNENAVLLNQALFNPTQETSLSVRFTQPLLRDFGPAVNRARIVINQNNQRVSVLAFREELENQLLATEEAFWNLYVAERAVEIQADLLEATRQTARRINDRLAQDADAGQVAQALQRVYQRQQAVVQALAQLQTQSVQLKLQMNDPDLPVSGGALLRTATPPLTEPLQFDFERGVETAVIYRTQLGQQLLRVLSARTALQVARSNIRPRLDLVLSGGLQGLDEDFGGAIDNQFGGDGVNVGAGLQFEIPLGNRAARAVLRRALLQEMQALAQYAQLVRDVTASVKVAQVQVNANYLVLKLAAQEVEAAAEQVRVLTQREELDAELTPQFSDLKLRALDQLADARVRQAQATADYNLSLAQYEQSKGTLLRYNNIVLKESDADGRLNPVLREVLEGE